MKVMIKVHVHARQSQRYDADSQTFCDAIEWEAYPFDMSSSSGGRVNLGVQEISVEVPDNYDMRSGIVGNLEREKKQLTAEFQARVTAIESQIQKYLAIENKPGEVVA